MHQGQHARAVGGTGRGTEQHEVLTGRGRAAPTDIV